jgi:uncharacterized protein YjbI with pentapeptide repeats
MARHIYLSILTQAERRTAIIGTVLYGRVFRGVDLSDCRLEYSDCHATLFAETDLRGAEFFGANLQRACFVRCDLTGARFLGAKVRDAHFISCRGLSGQQTGWLNRRHAYISFPEARGRSESSFSHPC